MKAKELQPVEEILRAAAARGRTLASSAKMLVYSDEESEALKAMDAYKRDHCRPNPTICEILAVLKSLGYEKKAP